jgi:hypothetical protein
MATMSDSTDRKAPTVRAHDVIFFAPPGRAPHGPPIVGAEVVKVIPGDESGEGVEGRGVWAMRGDSGLVEYFPEGAYELAAPGTTWSLDRRWGKYQIRIAGALAEVGIIADGNRGAPRPSPRHVEAWMRIDHVDLDALSPQDFASEARRAAGCARAVSKELSERVCEKMGMAPVVSYVRALADRIREEGDPDEEIND